MTWVPGGGVSDDKLYAVLTNGEKVLVETGSQSILEKKIEALVDDCNERGDKVNFITNKNFCSGTYLNIDHIVKFVIQPGVS